MGDDEDILQVTHGVPEGCITARVGQEWGKARVLQGDEVGT